ncbi:outer membrane beta-barrel protein [Pedobacter caeni]|uniref:Outer membrane protein beta-barrel domain-containing protein n=1 Tax=Pedobacter caeni TaxID=288992 RepID=A0A1M5EFS0_9SPHI|nr:outer membrane beta-barrel protein [Pedobacter caeni]SHF78026.1 Outer membrane protein beta-barrel domain-containing protein [Pedobacter caeni]
MKRFLCGLLLALPLLSSAQLNFHKGYVLTNSKDTLKGYLDYKEGKNNPVSVIFKSELNGNLQTYNLKNCAGYQINEMVSYQRHQVNISLSPEALSAIPQVIDTTSRRDTVFLQVLQSGQHLTLFSYEDDIKKRFFILDKGEVEPQELIRLLYFKSGNSGAVLTNARYARQLLMLLRKYNKLTPAIESRLGRLNYDQADLLKLVGHINDQEPEKSRFPKSRFFVGLGVNASTLGFTGAHELAGPDAKSKLSFGPTITAGVDVFANPAIRKMVFRMELALMMGSNSASTLVRKQSFDQMEAVLTPQLIYHFYNAEAFKAFFGVGVGLNFASYRNQKAIRHVNDFFTGAEVIKENEPSHMLDLQSFYFNFPVTAGVVLNKKIELSLGYSMPTALTNYTYFNADKQRFRLGINYLFGKH